MHRHPIRLLPLLLVLAGGAAADAAPMECLDRTGNRVVAHGPREIRPAPAEAVALRFAEPQSLDTLARWARQGGLGALDMRLEGTFEIGGEQLYESLTLGSHEAGVRLADADSVRAELVRLRTTLFHDALTVRSPFGASSERSQGPGERAMREALASGSVPGELAVHRLFVEPSGDSVGTLLELVFPRLEAVESRSVTCRRAEPEPGTAPLGVHGTSPRRDPPMGPSSGPRLPAGPARGSCTSPPEYPGSWQPNCGYQWVAPAGEGPRDAIAHFLLWWQPTFSGNATYEHDYWVHATDGLTLHDVTSTPYPDCMPVIKYWVVTYPEDSRPYLDTRFDITRCEDTLVPFTIGVADATRLVAGRVYSIRVYPYAGNWEVDTAELMAQRGHRSPPFCYSTWCVFADETSSILPGLLPPGTEWTVPGELLWTSDW